MPADYLSDLADELLAVALASLSEARTGTAPPKSWIAHGPPVADHCCDDDETSGQLTVHLTPFAGVAVRATRSGKGGPVQCQFTTHANFVVTLLRCVPVLQDSGDSPPVEDLDAAGGLLLVDLWALVRGVLDAHKANDLFSSVDCGAVEIGQADLVEEQGGCAGWTFSVTVRLSDLDPIPS